MIHINVFLSRGAFSQIMSILQVCAQCQEKTFISVMSDKKEIRLRAVA